MVPNEMDTAISDLESSLERLHALYNQYFLGIEKMEPKVQRKNVDRKIHALRRTQMNTAQKFRLQTQIQKYNTHSNHWKRICRQIEEGTYANHVSIAKRRQAQRAQKEAEARKSKEALASLDMDEDYGQQEEPLPVFEIDMDSFDLDDPFAERASPPDTATKPKKTASEKSGIPLPKPRVPAKSGVPLPKPSIPAKSGVPLPKPSVPPRAAAPIPPKGRPAKHPKPSSAGQPRPALDKARAAKIYRTYIAALERCKQPTSNVTLEKIERSLSKKVVAGKGNVDFKVVIRGGKATIKAVRKESN